jgi:hypothetical protein
MNIPTVPCKVCGEPTRYLAVKLCDRCWYVEDGLEEYLKHAAGRENLRRLLPVLDDWKDDKPNAWDYEAVLRDNEVTVEWCGTLVDGDGREWPAGELAGWGFYWKHGAIHIGQTTEVIARKAAALFVSLWLRGVSASFCDKLMDGFIGFLERQENATLDFLAEVDRYPDGRQFFRLTREGLMARQTLDHDWKIVEALNVQSDEEVIVTFTKRKKCPNL